MLGVTLLLEPWSMLCVDEHVMRTVQLVPSLYDDSE